MGCMRARGSRVALLAGVVAAAVAGLVLLQWREIEIQTVADGRMSGPRWADGPSFPSERVAEVQSVIEAAGKDEPVGVVYLRRVRATSSR